MKIIGCTFSNCSEQTIKFYVHIYSNCFLLIYPQSSKLRCQSSKFKAYILFPGISMHCRIPKAQNSKLRHQSLRKSLIQGLCVDLSWRRVIHKAGISGNPFCSIAAIGRRGWLKPSFFPVRVRDGTPFAGVAELAYAADLKSAAERIRGSSPLPSTT